MTEEQLKNVHRLSLLTDQALREIIYTNGNVYLPYMVQAAKTELCSRYADILGDEEFVTVHTALRDLCYDDVKNQLEAIEGKTNLRRYRQLYHDLIGAKPAGQAGALTLHFAGGSSRHILLTDGAGETTEGYDLSDGEWLSVRVRADDLLLAGREKITALILINMAYMGFDRSCLNQNTKQAAPAGGAAESDALGMPDEPAEQEKERAANRQQMHPWLRFLARYLDISIYMLIIYTLWRSVSPDTYIMTAVFLKWISLTAVAGIVVEIVLLAIWGNTPGKKLLGIGIRSKSGGKISLGQAFARSLLVWSCGNGLYTAFTLPLAHIIGYVYLKKTGAAWWDEKCGLAVTHQPVGGVRIAAAVVLIALLGVAGYFIAGWFNQAYFI